MNIILVKTLTLTFHMGYYPANPIKSLYLFNRVNLLASLNSEGIFDWGNPHDFHNNETSKEFIPL